MAPLGAELYAWIPRVCTGVRGRQLRDAVLDCILEGGAVPSFGGPQHRVTLFELLTRACRAYWVTDFAAMRQVARDLNNWSSDTAAQMVDTGTLSHVLEELNFLITALLDTEGEPERPEPPDSPALPGCPSAHEISRMLPRLWQALRWSGARLSLGLYREAVEGTEAFVPWLPYWPAAYRQRAAVIRGICLQEMGRFAGAAVELAIQDEVHRTFPSRDFAFAIRRRQLSLALNTENLELAIAIERQMAAAAPRVGSPFLLTLFAQESIKLSLMQGQSSPLSGLLARQESLIAQAGIPESYVVPLEERCALALEDGRPRDALAAISEQAWLARRNGMVNGQLVAGMVLLQCQIKLGQRRAALTTLNELRYLCRSYDFGRDALRVRMLEVVWHLWQGDVEGALHALLAAEAMAMGLGLPLHRTAIRFFAFVVQPTRERLLVALPKDPQPLVHARASLRLCLRWLELSGYAAAHPFGFLSELILETRPGTHSSHGLVPLGIWVVGHVTAENKLVAACVSFAERTIHDKWLGALLHARSSATLSTLHATVLPHVPYVEARHRERLLEGLRSLRAALRRRLRPVAVVCPQLGTSFCVLAGGSVSLHPEPRVWRLAEAPVERRQGRHKGSDGVRSDSPRRRTNRPVVPATIEHTNRRILLWLRQHGPSSGSQMATGMGLARKSLHVYLKGLVAEQRVQLSGLGRSARYSLRG